MTLVLLIQFINFEILIVDEKLNEKWSSGQDLPKHYLKRCQMLFSATQCVESVNRIRCLFSKGVLLLVNSCSTPTDDGAQLACLKLLYLANQFYVRFKEIIIDDKELVSYIYNFPNSLQTLKNTTIKVLRIFEITQNLTSVIQIQFSRYFYSITLDQFSAISDFVPTFRNILRPKQCPRTFRRVMQ